MQSVQDIAKTTGGVTGKGFLPGQSGNPGGRPKGFARRIRAETRDGEELAEVVLTVLRDPKSSRRDRMEAATWLADRGFGRPIQATATVDVPAPPPMSEGAQALEDWLQSLSVAQLRELVDGGAEWPRALPPVESVT